MGSGGRLCDWDPAKAAANIRDHAGVTFEEGETVLEDPNRVELADDDNADGELRTQVIGFSSQTRLLFVVIFEELEGSDRPRMISARRATSQEASLYADENQA